MTGTSRWSTSNSALSGAVHLFPGVYSQMWEDGTEGGSQGCACEGERPLTTQLIIIDQVLQSGGEL
jgi:hypothetical protein